MTAQTKTLLGIPVGDFGFFQSILVSVSLGFMSFFAATFLSIIGVSVYKGVTNSPVTLAISYKYIAFPLSLVVLTLAFCYLMSIWAMRKRREARQG